MVQRETETKNVVDDIETRALELERQKALLEQELARGQGEVSSYINTVLEQELARGQGEVSSYINTVLEQELARGQGEVAPTLIQC